jgi:hypothetical protein
MLLLARRPSQGWLGGGRRRRTGLREREKTHCKITTGRQSRRGLWVSRGLVFASERDGGLFLADSKDKRKHRRRYHQRGRVPATTVDCLASSSLPSLLINISVTDPASCRRLTRTPAPIEACPPVPLSPLSLPILPFGSATARSSVQ